MGGKWGVFLCCRWTLSYCQYESNHNWNSEWIMESFLKKSWWKNLKFSENLNLMKSTRVIQKLQGLHNVSIRHRDPVTQFPFHSFCTSHNLVYLVLKNEFTFLFFHNQFFFSKNFFQASYKQMQKKKGKRFLKASAEEHIRARQEQRKHAINGKIMHRKLWKCPKAKISET